jgi:hypothetical protein
MDKVSDTLNREDTTAAPRPGSCPLARNFSATFQCGARLAAAASKLIVPPFTLTRFVVSIRSTIRGLAISESPLAI